MNRASSIPEETTPSMASKYLTLILFFSLTSLPLFFFMLYYEKLLEKTLAEFIKILTPPDNTLPTNPSDQFTFRHLTTYPESQIQWLSSINPEFLERLASLCLLHLFPFHLLTTISTVHLAAKILSDEEPPSLMITIKEKLKGIFITWIYVLSLSTCALVGFLWLSIQSYTLSMTSFFSFDPMFMGVYPMVIVILLVKFLELSAVWNMSLVISILEEVGGLRAFSLAFYFNKGREFRGLVIMFVFFVLGLALRLLCLFEGGDRVVARTGLLWAVNLVKWVSFTWYFVDCKNRVLQNKADLEMGRRIEG